MILASRLLRLSQTRLAYSRAWHLIDVGSDPRPLGRLASQIAITLMGKHKPIWDPSTDCGDYVVAVGCHDMHTTGKKRFNKKYYSHTTRPGSLKEITMDNMFAKWGGSEVLRRAVRGMLPKNRLRDDRMARLKRKSTHACNPYHFRNPLLKMPPSSQSSKALPTLTNKTFSKWTTTHVYPNYQRSRRRWPTPPSNNNLSRFQDQRIKGI